MAALAFVPLYTLLSTFNAKPIIHQTVFAQRDRFRLLQKKKSVHDELINEFIRIRNGIL